MKRQTKLALAGAGTALAVVIAGTGVASAAGDAITSGNNPFSRVLDSLVSKGTITKSQADAIVAATEADRAARDADHEARHADMEMHRAAEQKLIADTLGLEWSAIQTRLQAGETLGAIAGDKKAALTTALVAFEKSELDAAVKAGRITEAQATEMKANVEQRVADKLAGTGRMGKGPRGDGDGDGFGPRGGRGHHGRGFGPGDMGNGLTDKSSTNG